MLFVIKYTFKKNINKICVKDNISFDRKVPKKQAEQRDGKLIRAREEMLKILKTKQAGRGTSMRLERKVSSFSITVS